MTLVSACGLVLGLEDGIYVSPDGGGEDVTPTGDSSGDAGADTSDAREPPKDVIDIEANFASCDGATTLAIDAVYVSPTGADNNGNCGKASAPCQTIATALTLAAKTTGKTIYLGHGDPNAPNAVYDELVTINQQDQDKLVIQGGFDDYPDAAWVQNCNQQKAIIKSRNNDYTVLLSGYSATLRLVHVESRDNAPDDESVYAVVVNNGGKLTLDNTLLVAQNGGRGTDGAQGGMGSGCNNGSGGKVGAAGAPGTFSASSYLPTTAGTGDQGGAGPGQSGAMGTCDNNCGMCAIFSVFGLDGGVDGGPDGGPPDGGPPDGGGCLFTKFNSMRCGQPGDLGCGGSGGLGGEGGKGGGTSIALYVDGTTSKVTLINGVSLNTANGGNGGNGGAGGAGAPGMTGNDGIPFMCDIGCGDGGLCDFISLDGGAGGTGATGGVGNNGGGGAGGPTYLYVAPNLMQIDSTLAAPNWLTMNSKLGAGGSGGKPNGNAGEAKASRKIP